MKRFLGLAGTTYFGGRAEVRIRRWPLPVRYIDFTSMYPTVFALLGLWRWVVAERYHFRAATSAARRILRKADRGSLHHRDAWPQLPMVFCRIRPAGAMLPTRARYTDDAGAWTIGINHLSSPIDLWFTLADLVAAKLLDGTQVEILEAFRIEPVGVLPGLRSLNLRGTVPADPSDDLFRLAIEERHRLARAGGAARDLTFLKTFANGGAYGVFAEYRLLEAVAAGVPVEAHGLWPIAARVQTPEEPGEFSFPPLAATVTGAARLLLSLLQADIEARGGSFVACDTDSLNVVTTENGGLLACPGGPRRLSDGRPAAIKALSDAELDAALAEIERLNPYRQGTVSRLVKLEAENFALDGSGSMVGLRALAISPKRYVLYELAPDGPLIRKASSHGLGMYRTPVRNPDGWDKVWPYWVDLVWQSIIRDAEALAPLPEPDWYDLPAVSQLSITSPGQLLPFAALNRGRAYRDQIKPFSFMLIGHGDPLAPLPSGMSSDQLTPIAPYTAKPEELLSLPWVNRHDGRRLRVTTAPQGEAGAVRLKTYRDVIREYRLHPDAKSGDPAGGQAHRGSVGLLPRLHIRATEVRHIGKESNRMDEEEEGALVDADRIYVEYTDERSEWFAVVAPQLANLQNCMGVRELRLACGLSERALRDAVGGRRFPRPRARAALRLALECAFGAAGTASSFASRRHSARNSQ